MTQLMEATRSNRHVSRPRSAIVNLPRLDRMGLHTPGYLHTRAVCKACSKFVSDKCRKEHGEVPDEVRPKKPRPSESFVAR